MPSRVGGLIGAMSCSEWRRLSSLASVGNPLLLSGSVNCIVAAEGEAHVQGLITWIRASVVSAHGGSSVKVVLKLRTADWIWVRHSRSCLKILQAVVLGEEQPPILDVSQCGSTIVAAVPLEHHTSITVAELFCGGFSGWSQSVYVLHRAGVPVHMAWKVDHNKDVLPMLLGQDPDLHVIEREDEFELVAPPGHNMLVADIAEDWWLRAFSAAMPQVVTISSPCQAWSSAAYGKGLSCQEGRLLLRAADICGAMMSPVVLLEQVEGFWKHADCAAVLKAWGDVGYTMQWKATLDLQEVLPTTRRRFLAVLTHRRLHPFVPSFQEAWSLGARPTLRSACAIFNMPLPLLEPLILSPETLKLYLRPDLIPKRLGAARAPDASRFRIRSGPDTASCFMAMYTRQHELPFALLESKGLLGSLVYDGTHVRFFGQPEISSMHGLQQPLRISADTAVEMQLLGNAISTPHAIATLAQGLRCLGVSASPSIAQAVRLAVEGRIHADNSVFLPMGDGWLLCHEQQLPGVLVSTRLKTLSPLPRVSAFRRWDLQTLELSCEMQIATCLTPPSVSAHVGRSAKEVPCATCATQAPRVFEVTALPELGCFEWTSCEQTGPCATVLADGTSFVLPKQGSLAWSHVLAVGQHMQLQEGHELSLFDPAGARLQDLAQLPTLFLGIEEAEDSCWCEPEFSYEDVKDLRLFPVAERLCWHVSPDKLDYFRLSFPVHLLRPLGWKWCEEKASVAPFAVALSLCPLPDQLTLAADKLRHLIRVWLFRAQLAELTGWEHWPLPFATHPVEVHVVARKVWGGRLPVNMHISSLETLWGAASVAVGLPEACRIFSGPERAGEDATVQCLRDGIAKVRLSRHTARPILTVHPEMRGGGSKTDTKEWAQAAVAKACLDNGLELSRTSTFAAKLVEQCTPKKLELALHEQPPLAQWEAIQDLAQQAGIAIPVASAAAAKAEARMLKAQASRKLPRPAPIAVEDVTVAPGFFQNEDGSEAQIVQQMRPGASGVYLVSVEQARDLLAAMPSGQADALGLLVLGHECPQPSSCSGRVSFPGLARHTKAPLLLAACLHNVGSATIRTSLAHNGKVDLPAIAVCLFEAAAPDFEPAQWARMCASPVRAVLDLFAESGAAQAFSAPWSRKFLLKDRPSTPQEADRLSFLAKVERGSLSNVLSVSGHNGVFCTPRTAELALDPDFSVIWIGHSRTECAKLSLQVGEQRGLVKARGRYGLRVPSAQFRSLHQLLRPGASVPERFPVNHVYRLGPLPRSAGPKEVQEWSQQVPWRLKTLKMSGPCHWIVGSESPPPSLTMGWNGQTILAVAVEQPHKARSALESGKLPSRQVTPTADKSGPADPWQHYDPWKGAQFPGKDKAPVPEPKTNLGPVEQRFQAQETRLQALEQGLQSFRDDHKRSREEDRAEASSQAKAVEAHVNSIARDLSEQMRLAAQLAQDAQLRQQEQLQSSLDELKSLITAPLTPMRKQARSGDQGQDH